MSLSSISCLLIRHGQTDWNKMNKVQGQTDHSQLTLEGESQAKAVGEVLLRHPFLQYKTIEIWTSELSRTRKTGEIIAQVLGFPISSIQSDARLNEANLGKFEGKTTDEYEKDEDYMRRAALPEKERFFVAPDPVNGESYAKVAKRAREAIAEICAKNQEAVKIIISHAGVIDALRKDVTDRYTFPGIKNGEIVVIQVDKGQFSLIEQD